MISSTRATVGGRTEDSFRPEDMISSTRATVGGRKEDMISSLGRIRQDSGLGPEEIVISEEVTVVDGNLEFKGPCEGAQANPTALNGGVVLRKPDLIPNPFKQGSLRT